MQSIVIFLLVATLFGASVVLLVSKDLAARAGLSGLARYLLAAALSFGVISIAIKSAIAMLVSSNIGFFNVEPTPPDPNRSVAIEREYAPPLGYRPWKSLDAQPRATIGNAPTPEKVALGRRLFHDKRLSADGKVSCASCHKIEAGGDDDLPTSIGIEGLMGTRNAPTVINAAYLSRFFWDGRAASLEEQAKGPLVNPVEMAMPSLDDVVRIVSTDEVYKEYFEHAFGPNEIITIDRIAQAIASYERTLVSQNAPYDRFVRGDQNALTAQQQYGMLLFDEVGCRNCHQDPTFSASDLGVYRTFPVFAKSSLIQPYDFLKDKGRLPSAGGEGPGLWRVPSLRNVEHTAPYFHNGSVKSLDEAVRIMASAQLGYDISETPIAVATVQWNPELSRMSRPQHKTLGPEELDALAAFLKSLSPPTDDFNVKE